MKKIAILGAGSWGTALAMVLAENQHEARLWGNNEAQIKEINERHTNEHFLPGVFLDPSIRGYLDLAEAVKDVDAILFVLPTKAIRIVAKQLNELLNSFCTYLADSIFSHAAVIVVISRLETSSA